MSGQFQSDQEVLVRWFENHYHCFDCGISWDDEWSCMCDDRCPECGDEIQPTTSSDMSRPLTKNDFERVAKLFHKRYPGLVLTVSEKDAREYAEALLEGGEHRFREEEISRSGLPAGLTLVRVRIEK